MYWKKKKRKRNQWCNDVCERGFIAKMEARKKWLRSGRLEDREVYERIRKDCKEN